MIKREKIIYTLLIVMMNEFAIAFYNNLFHTNAFLHESFTLAVSEFIPAFIFGVICELLIVSRISKHFSKLLKEKGFIHSSIYYIDELILGIGMMLVVSIYGLFIHQGMNEFSIRILLDDFIKNSIFGLPFFIIVVHPIARRITVRVCNATTNK